MFRNFYKSKLAALVPMAALILSGCVVGPNYKRPAVDVPTVYRQPADEPNDQAAKPSGNQVAPTPSAANKDAVSLGDENWWEVFQDKELQNLIRTALKNNYDVRIAATRVLEAQAQLGITRADQLPSLGAGGTIASQQNPKIGPIPSYELTQGNLTASAAWNPDF